MDNLVELYCDIDDFYQSFESESKQYRLVDKGNKKRRNRPSGISVPEIMTILVLFHQVRYREFKSFYFYYLMTFLRKDFPNLPSYNRFIELVPRAIMPMCAYLSNIMGKCNGVSYIDSSKLVVCHNRRIHQHKTFDGLAERGKSSTGWFFGFKLHTIINDKGELLAIKVTKGNVDDRVPVREMCNNTIFGKLFGDKGYVGQELADDLLEKNDIQFITKIRKNMKTKKLTRIEKRLLKRRSLIETVFGELKELCQIEHSRHRSITGFVSNLLGGLIAYCWQPKKPKLRDVFIDYTTKQDKNEINLFSIS